MNSFLWRGFTVICCVSGHRTLFIASLVQRAQLAHFTVEVYRIMSQIEVYTSLSKDRAQRTLPLHTHTQKPRMHYECSEELHFVPHDNGDRWLVGELSVSSAHAQCGKAAAFIRFIVSTVRIINHHICEPPRLVSHTNFQVSLTVFFCVRIKQQCLSFIRSSNETIVYLSLRQSTRCLSLSLVILIHCSYRETNFHPQSQFDERDFKTL